MWVEIAVSCLFCPKSFFYYYFKYSTIPLSSKTTICFQSPISKNPQSVWEIIKYLLELLVRDFFQRCLCWTLTSAVL